MLLAAALNGETPALWRPGAGERVSPGATLEARWALSSSDPRVGDEAELLLSLDGGHSFPLRVSREVFPESGRAVWRVPSLPSSHARLALRTGLSLLFIVDIAFLLANLTKLEEGGWLPLVSGLIIYWLMQTWQRGQQCCRRRLRSPASAPIPPPNPAADQHDLPLTEIRS